MNERGDLPPISEDVKRTWKHSRHDISAGGVAYRHAGDEFEVALIATRGGTRWQLPKGSQEQGESSLQTAIREVAEEVGLTTKSQGFLRTIDFWYWDTYRKTIPELVHKRVDFFLLAVVDGVISDASHEVDGVAWFTLEQALQVLTFKGERSVVRLAQEKLRATPSS